MTPSPPQICTAASTTSWAVSVACIFAMAASRVTRFCFTSRIQAARYASSAAASMPVAMSASFVCVSWKSASAWPNIFLSRARSSASARARRAKPSPGGERRDVRTRVGLGQRESCDRLASRGPPDVATLLLLGAGERHGTAAQSLHGEGEIGEAGVEGEHLAQHRQRAYVEARIFGRAVREEPRRAQILHQTAADGIRVFVVRVA